MKNMNETETRTGRSIYRWLSYLVAVTFILMGIGILTKILLPEPFLMRSSQRLIMGGIILVYGIARLITLYLKRKRDRFEEKN